eukprot:gene7145-5042_t
MSQVISNKPKTDRPRANLFVVVVVQWNTTGLLENFEDINAKATPISSLNNKRTQTYYIKTASQKDASDHRVKSYDLLASMSAPTPKMLFNYLRQLKCATATRGTKKINLKEKIFPLSGSSDTSLRPKAVMVWLHCWSPFNVQLAPGTQKMLLQPNPTIQLHSRRRFSYPERHLCYKIFIGSTTLSSYEKYEFREINYIIIIIIIIIIIDPVNKGNVTMRPTPLIHLTIGQTKRIHITLVGFWLKRILDSKCVDIPKPGNSNITYGKGNSCEIIVNKLEIQKAPIIINTISGQRIHYLTIQTGVKGDQKVKNTRSKKQIINSRAYVKANRKIDYKNSQCKKYYTLNCTTLKIKDFILVNLNHLSIKYQLTKEFLTLDAERH